MSDTSKTGAAIEVTDFNCSHCEIHDQGNAVDEVKRQLAEARELAGEMREAIKVAREQLAEAREENARLREAVKDARDCILHL